MHFIRQIAVFTSFSDPARVNEKFSVTPEKDENILIKSSKSFTDLASLNASNSKRKKKKKKKKNVCMCLFCLKIHQNLKSFETYFLKIFIREN